MWLFTSKSFLSVVSDQENPSGDKLLVRARVSGDIEEIFPDATVMHTPNADYRFRAWVSRSDVADALSDYVRNLNYANFKNSVHDMQRVPALIQVWNSMYQLQERQF